MPLILADPLVENDTIIGPLPNFNLPFETFFVQKSAALLFNHSINELLVHFKNFTDLSWMHSIQLARFPKEQNIEIIYNNGSVYFKTTRQILMNEELYAFPSKDLEISLGLVFVPLRNDQLYTCKKCTKSFNFPNSLMLHSRYFCSARTNNFLSQSILNLSQKQNNLMFSYLQNMVSQSYLAYSNYENILSQHGKSVSNSSSRIRFSPTSIIKAPNPQVQNANKITSRRQLYPEPSIVLNEPQTSLENWCAKCNTSFRLTSDLVYHMRTIHRKNEEAQSLKSMKPVNSSHEFLEFSKKLLESTGQPSKTSRDHKTLKCEICFEYFKEKHHLSRHMTSHR